MRKATTRATWTNAGRTIIKKPPWLVFGLMFCVLGYFYCTNPLAQEGHHKIDGKYQRT